MSGDDYQPLFAEKRCMVCGFWRGQHLGASVNDVEMICPEGVGTAFVPGEIRGVS